MTHPTPQEKKAEFRVFWIDETRAQLKTCEKLVHRVYLGNPWPPDVDNREPICVIEYSAITEANERIKVLERDLHHKNGLVAFQDENSRAYFADQEKIKSLESQLTLTQAALEKAKEEIELLKGQLIAKA